VQILRQSTAVDVLIGPFVDITDGAAAEVGESPAVKLSKNGQTMGTKNEGTTPAHDADGYYNCQLDATDTNTVGTMVLTVVASATALPVRHEFMVVEESVYDSLYVSGASDVADLKSGIIYGAAQTGTLSTTECTTDLTGYGDDQLIGGVLIFLSGPCEGERKSITDYTNTNGLIEHGAMTTVPTNGDLFKIV